MTYFCCDCGYELNGLPLCPECGTRQTELARFGAMLRRHRRSLQTRVGVIVACGLVCAVAAYPRLRIPETYRVATIGAALAVTYVVVWWLTYRALRTEGAARALEGATWFAVVLMVVVMSVMGSLAGVLVAMFWK